MLPHHECRNRCVERVLTRRGKSPQAWDADLVSGLQILFACPLRGLADSAGERAGVDLDHARPSWWIERPDREAGCAQSGKNRDTPNRSRSNRPRSANLKDRFGPYAANRVGRPVRSSKVVSASEVRLPFAGSPPEWRGACSTPFLAMQIGRRSEFVNGFKAVII